MFSPILRAIIENMISPDYVLCYIPRAMAILSWKWKFWNLPVRRRRPLWCHWRPLCSFGNFWKKNLDFGIFFRFTDETFTHRRHLLIASIRYDARSITYLIVVAYGYLSSENWELIEAMGKCRLWVNVAWVNVAMGICRMGICRLTRWTRHVFV